MDHICDVFSMLLMKKECLLQFCYVLELNAKFNFNKTSLSYLKLLVARYFLVQKSCIESIVYLSTSWMLRYIKNRLCVDLFSKIYDILTCV